MRLRIRRYIALFLVLVLTISSIPITSVHAVENDESIIAKSSEVVQSVAEETLEALLDSNSKNSAGEWHIAVFEDGFYWNSFHNKVQADIRFKNKDIEPKELSITYGENNGKLKGKKGRADLYRNKEEITYLWEVKPLSYAYEPNKTLGLTQLSNYVKSNPNRYVCGNSYIGDGQTSLSKTIVRENGEIEKVTYIIDYYNGQNGMIYYKFKRQVTKEDKQPNESTVTEKEEEKATSAMPAKAKVVNELLNTVPMPITEESTEPSTNSTIETKNRNAKIIETVVTGAVIAGVILYSTKVLNKDKISTYFATIKAACIKYLSKVSIITANAAGNGEIDQATIDEANAALDEFMTALEVFGYDELLEELEKAMQEGDQEKIDELLKKIQEEAENYDKAGEAQPPRDPLAIDLGETGIVLHSLDNGVHFDLDNNGFAERTAWIGTEDGFLVLDRNGNGKIDNGGELFGDQVTLKNGEKSASGFEALAELDDNEDEKISKKDEAYNQLLVWIDADHNGKSKASELKKLSELEIVSISLKHTEKSIVDEETGTRIAETADVKIKQTIGNKTVEISEFWFPIDSSKTTQGGKITAGHVPNLEQAIVDDETGELYQLICDFSESNDIAQKRYYSKQILYFITGASNIAANSRGGNMDARDLHVIEQFMGREFVGVDGSNPNVNAASILQGMYCNIEEYYYNILNMYSSLGGYLLMALENEDDNGNRTLDMTILNYLIGLKISNGEDVDAIIYDLGVYLKSYDKIYGTSYFNEYSKHYSAISTHYSDIVKWTEISNTYIGTDEVDSYGGTNRIDFIFGKASDDNLYGGNGDDSVNGEAGNDVLDGGLGNDSLNDNSGNDTYVFTKGYGTDTISDNGGKNTIRFTNINSDSILVNGTDENDVTITIKGENDKLIIKDFCKSDELTDYKLEFKDKTIHCLDAESPFRHIYGTDSDERLKAVVADSYMHAFSGDDTVIGSKGVDIIYGNEGNDTITAGESNDTVYGGSGDNFVRGENGDDILYSDDGQDTLDGGSGNDYLFAGKGNDTYLFGKDYGTDIVEDAAGISTIQLKDNLTTQDLDVIRIGNELTINIKGTQDKLIISNYGNNPDDFLFMTVGGEISIKEVMKVCEPSHILDGVDNVKYIAGSENADAIFAEKMKNLIMSGLQNDYIVGNDNSDIIFGDSDTDRILAGLEKDIIYGGNDNDQMFGEADDDFLVGNAGNDYISAGDGNDIVLSESGDDFMEGGAGNDIYFFNVNNGNDSIMDSEGDNIIIFGDGLFAKQIKAYRQNWNDLLITFEDSTDTLTIKNYCINDEARSFQLIFADGVVTVATDKNSPLRQINDKEATEYMPSIYQDGVIIVSTDGDDQLEGSENADTLIGGEGNNRINGKGGDDTLEGGKGIDYLAGGLGADTYIYRKGYGTDTISDIQDTNSIEILGYDVSDVKAYQTNWNNITIVLDGSGEAGLNDENADKITIENFFVDQNGRNFYLLFNGLRIHATDNSSPLRILHGTSENESLQGFDEGKVAVYGNDGNDTLNGNESENSLYGGNGDDRLLGLAGNDVLSGESGNDYMEGGSGDDTYAFSQGSGIDTINDNQGENSISLGEGMDNSNITAYRTDWNNLTIKFKDIEDTLIIRDYFTSANHRKFNVKFADGSSFKFDDSDNPINQVYATENDDWMSAWSDDGVSFNGAAGNDNFTGGAGNDVIAGGVGDDTLAGNAGDDIYLFSIGDGVDTITDAEGENKIVFKDVTSDKISFVYEINDNITKLIISFPETNERIVLKDFKEENYIFEFADGIMGRVIIVDSVVTFVPAEEVQS